MDVFIFFGKSQAPRDLSGSFVRSLINNSFKISAVVIHDLMHVGVQGAYLNALCQISVWLVIRALNAVVWVMHFYELQVG